MTELVVVAAAAVATADVQQAVRTEGQLTAVVVGLRLAVGEDHALAGGIGLVRVVGGDLEFGDDRDAVGAAAGADWIQGGMAGQGGVVDVEPAMAR